MDMINSDISEIWKPIKGYEGKYEVSNFGKVKSLKRYKRNNSKMQLVEERILSSYINKKNGYVYVYLCNDGKYKNHRLHRVVAESFIPNPNNYDQINHIDGNRANNRVENLEWCDTSYNIKDMYKRNGTYSKDNIVVDLYSKYKNCNTVAKLMGMSGQGIQGVLKRNNIHIYSKNEKGKIRV